MAPKKRGFTVQSEEGARADAVELAAFIHDLQLTQVETVELLTAVLMGFAGELEVKQVEDQITEIARVAMERLT